MQENLATSAVLFAAGSVVIALVLCVALRRHKRGDPAIWWLIGSNLAFLTAALGVLARPWLGFEVSAALVVAAAFAGICMAHAAVMVAERQPTGWRGLALLGLGACALQTMIAVAAPSVLWLMLSSSAINSTLLLWMMRRIWHVALPHGPRIATLLCLPFAALFVGYAGRLIACLGWPETDGPIIATLLIIVAMAWAAVVLELAMIALREVQAREALRAALSRAEQAAAARTAFLLGISHDLRTPLNAILGLSELMRQQALGPIPQAYQQHVEHVHANGRVLHELVEDLLLATSNSAAIEDKADGAAIDAAVKARMTPPDALRRQV